MSMSYDAELIETVRKNWITNIFEYANASLQKKSWIEGPQADWKNAECWCSCYDDLTSNYFSDIALHWNDDQTGKSVFELERDYDKVVEAGLFTEAEARLVINLHKRICRFPYESSKEPGALDDPEWQAIIHAAIQVWNSLKNVLKNPEEIKLMNQLERDYGVIPK